MTTMTGTESEDPSALCSFLSACLFMCVSPFMFRGFIVLAEACSQPRPDKPSHLC